MFYPLNGFLPAEAPLSALPDPYFERWEMLVTDLPVILGRNQLRRRVLELPILWSTRLRNEQQLRRAFVILSFLTQAFIWDGDHPSEKVPACLAVPYCAVANSLGMPSIGTFAAYCLWNWRKIDLDGDMGPENIATVTSFTGTADERWFFGISIAIEAKGAFLVSKISQTLRESKEISRKRFVEHMCEITEGLQDMTDTLNRMRENCSPHVFFHVIRPWLAGSKNMEQQGLSRGVLFDLGFDAEVYSALSGGSNAQSSLFQYIDLALGLQHRSKMGGEFLEDMRRYMPREHREFLAATGQDESLKSILDKFEIEDDKACAKAAYERTLAAMVKLRNTHLKIVAQFIVIPKSQDGNRESDRDSRIKFRGTGGTSAIDILKQCRDDVNSCSY